MQGFWSSSRPRPTGSLDTRLVLRTLTSRGQALAGAGFWHILYSNQPPAPDHCVHDPLFGQSEEKETQQNYSECTRCMALEVMTTESENSTTQKTHILSTVSLKVQLKLNIKREMVPSGPQEGQLGLFFTVEVPKRNMEWKTGVS